MRTQHASSLFTMAIAISALASCVHDEHAHAEHADEHVHASPVAHADRAAIARALAMSHRSSENKARDAHRHPLETLGFFGLRGNMTVLEMWPGTGWYTEVLAPIVADGGKLYVSSVDPDGPQDKPAHRFARELLQRFNAQPWVFNKVAVSRIDPPKSVNLAPENSVDLALVFRTTHDWVRDGYADEIYAAIFKAVKPGGTLGVVAHRGKPDASTDPKVVGKTGYLPEKFVIELIERAGFKLVDHSEVNANPKDVKDYPEGVWALPPSLRLKDKDREKYVAIGESDRMTLKFEKPAHEAHKPSAPAQK